jgi:CRISPR-associated protein Csd2
MTLVQLPNRDIICDPKRRHVAVFFWDIWMGNPNGDPERDNQPRQNSADQHGFVTDASIKRKLRDFWSLTLANQEGYRVYVQSTEIAGALNAKLEEAAAVTGTQGEASTTGQATKKKQNLIEDVARRRAYMIEHYIDIRLFGAVMATGNVPAGHTTGPVQISFAWSIDEIEIMDVPFVRVAVTREEDAKEGKVNEMGHKAVVPYALYRAYVIFNAPLAPAQGITSRDLELLWSALQSVWELDRSASKVMQGFRGLVIWSQDNPYGNAHAQSLLERVQVHLKPGKQFPRQFGDYDVTFDEEALPKGVTCTKIGFDQS